MNHETECSGNCFRYTIVSPRADARLRRDGGGLVSFLITRRSVSGRYRLASTLSAVVVSSAFFELYVLSTSWRDAFTFRGTPANGIARRATPTPTPTPPR